MRPHPPSVSHLESEFELVVKKWSNVSIESVDKWEAMILPGVVLGEEGERERGREGEREKERERKREREREGGGGG